MVSKTNSGFTIIETMLFLAVSGVLMAAIMVGVGTSIQQQRYRDSVNSLKSYLQDQYSAVSNTANSRSGAEACVNAVITAPDSQPVGTSDCLILGRFITADATGMQLTSSDVIGALKPGAVANLPSDIQELGNYTMSLSSVSSETYPIAWSMRVVKESAVTTAKPFSVMIVRSPRSGAIMTFSSATAMSPTTIVSAANNSTPLHLCVDGDRGVTGARLQEVLIPGYASNQGAVQVPIESDSVCGL